MKVVVIKEKEQNGSLGLLIAVLAVGILLLLFLTILYHKLSKDPIQPSKQLTCDEADEQQPISYELQKENKNPILHAESVRYDLEESDMGRITPITQEKTEIMPKTQKEQLIESRKAAK